MQPTRCLPAPPHAMPEPPPPEVTPKTSRRSHHNGPDDLERVLARLYGVDVEDVLGKMETVSNQVLSDIMLRLCRDQDSARACISRAWSAAASRCDHINALPVERFRDWLGGLVQDVIFADLLGVSVEVVDKKYQELWEDGFRQAAMPILKNREEAEDAVNEAWRLMLEKLWQLKDRSANGLRAWFCTTVRNKSGDLLRRKISERNHIKPNKRTAKPDTKAEEQDAVPSRHEPLLREGVPRKAIEAESAPLSDAIETTTRAMIDDIQASLHRCRDGFVNVLDPRFGPDKPEVWVGLYSTMNENDWSRIEASGCTVGFLVKFKLDETSGKKPTIRLSARRALAFACATYVVTRQSADEVSQSTQRHTQRLARACAPAIQERLKHIVEAHGWEHPRSNVASRVCHHTFQLYDADPDPQSLAQQVWQTLVPPPPDRQAKEAGP